MEDKTMLFSRVNDQNSWALDTDEGVIRFASEEDCQRMMRLIQSKNASARPEDGLIDEEFLAKVRDPRYSSEWVGIALRWRLDQRDKPSPQPHSPDAAPHEQPSTKE